jgi:hypothetical protein
LYAAFIEGSLADIMTTLLFITADLILTQALLQPALDQQSKTAMMQLSCAIAAEMPAQTAMDESRAPSADKFVFKRNVHENYFSFFPGPSSADLVFHWQTNTQCLNSLVTALQTAFSGRTYRGNSGAFRCCLWNDDDACALGRE